MNYSPYEIKNDFTHLHVHTRFSIRDAIPNPKKLVDHAKKLGFDALAITDHGNMGGHHQFAVAAAATRNSDGDEVNPIKSIFGIEAYLCNNITVKESIVIEDSMGNKKSRRPKHYHIVLLAKNEKGYENLKAMSYISAVDGFYYEPRIDWDILQKYHEGLICSSACLAGEIAHSILNTNNNTKDIIDKYKQLFKDDFYLEVQWHQMEEETKAYSEIMNLSKEFNIPLLATNDVHYITQSDAVIHDQFVAMKFKRDEEQGGSSDTRNLSSAYKKPEFYLKTADEMVNNFSDNISAIINTREVVEKCEFNYPLEHPIIWPACEINIDNELSEWRNKYFPELSMKQAFLLYKSMGGLKKLGLSKNKDYIDRLKYEWNIIFDMGYEEYFITQLMVVNICNEKNVLMGPARGSAAGSLALYTLGITKIDPLKFGLIFERFLNPGRGIGFNHNLPIMENNTKPKADVVKTIQPMETAKIEI